MAKTIAKCRGIGKTTASVASRLGHVASEAEANIWRTFTLCYVRADGSGTVKVKRDGKLLHIFDFGPE